MNYLTNRLLILLIFFVQTNFGFSQSKESLTAKEPAEEELNWLKSQIYPIEICEDKTDLSVLEKLVGKSKIVALGENTHDSKEIFNLKRIIIKFLVQKQGFDIFALEAGIPGSNKFNYFLNNDKKDLSALQLIKGLGYQWIWRNQEFIDLLEWMKIYNQGNSKITFTGIDMQFYQGSIKELEAIFVKNKQVLNHIAELNKFMSDINMSKRAKISNSYIKKSNRILSKIKKNIPLLTCEKDKKRARQNTRLLEQYLENKNKRHSLRDFFMAENLLGINRQNPDSRIVVWAHNEHIKKTDRRMGEYLAHNLNKDYTNIGFTFGAGNYHAINSKSKELSIQDAKEPPHDSYEYFFEKLGVRAFILDLRPIKKDNPELGKWLLKNRKFRRIGSIKPAVEFTDTNLSEDFDIIIYIEKSTATQIMD